MFGIFHSLTYEVDEFLTKRILGPFDTECEAYAAAAELLRRYDPEGYRTADLAVRPLENHGHPTNASVVQAYQDWCLNSDDYIHVFRMESAENLMDYLEKKHKESNGTVEI